MSERPGGSLNLLADGKLGDEKLSGRRVKLSVDTTL
jgi:hypothetical protein